MNQGHEQGEGPASNPPRTINLDVTDASTVAAERNGSRPFLKVFFRCANKYIHVPRLADGSGYKAMCPLCGKRVNFVVGPGGTSQRFFEISC